MLRAVTTELTRCPDATLVEVRDHDEHVIVRKVGNALTVRVDTNDEDLEIVVPVRTLDRVARKLERVMASGA